GRLLGPRQPRLAHCGTASEQAMESIPSPGWALKCATRGARSRSAPARTFRYCDRFLNPNLSLTINWSNSCIRVVIDSNGHPLIGALLDLCRRDFWSGIPCEQVACIR